MRITTYCFASVLLLLACNDQDGNKSNAATIVKRDTTPIHHMPANPYAPVDLSPMDMSYFPVDFPKLKMTDSVSGQPVARVIYSRPHRQGRKVFGSLLKYGEPWRLGANEATEIELFRDVAIQGKRVGKGRYILYCIPEPGYWTVVFNSNTFTWGLKIDTSKDLFRFKIPAQNSAIPIEFFTMVFEPTDAGASLVMTWDDVVARLPITLK